ncbi:MAG: IS1182 family transposase [Anaerolineae bacterium]|nr:IS1182 family transposase [Anaerolineae bacterium]
MTLHAQDLIHIPTETVRVARAAFPKGNVYMTMRDHLNLWYKDSDYAYLFVSVEGRPAESPGRLNLIMVMQYAEGLTDEQAAEAVRSRIDWKYALGLPLSDPGFEQSVLSKHRDRLLQSGHEAQLLDDMLRQMQAAKLLQARGRQRTDSTHVLAQTRSLNRLELIGETLRQALNELARENPAWLVEQISPDWFELYGPRFEQYRLPKEKKEQQALAEQMGRDGYHLLGAIDAAGTLSGLPALQTLRQVWIQQFMLVEGQVHLRDQDNCPPARQAIQTPYDLEARYSKKREIGWTGYKVHLTETCDDDRPRLITNVETTPASTPDIELTQPIQAHLAQKELLPQEHLLDTGYVDAHGLVASQADYQVELVGPAPSDNSWQTQNQSGFEMTCFSIDWSAQQVTCPQGHRSVNWYTYQNQRDLPYIIVQFSRADCAACPTRTQCTRAKNNPRQLGLRPQAEHTALQAARQYQTTDEFKQRYKLRAGIEGTISQGTRAFHLRRSRFIGLAKTHLHHLLVGAAINVTRAVFWLQDRPLAQTRRSPFAALAPMV